MTERLGDAPIEAKHRQTMNEVAQLLDQMFNGPVIGKNRKVGFVLLIFPFGEEEGRCNYISNGADRKDIVTLFKEQIKRFEGQPEMEGKSVIEPAIKALVHKLAERCWEGGEVDGGDLQEWLSEAGVIVPVTVNEPCGDNCTCADFTDFPTTCFRFAPEWK